MPLLVYLNTDYLLPRFALWVALFVVALVDGWRHKGIRSRGYQLFFALVTVVGLYCIREAILLAFAVTTDGQGGSGNGLFDAYIAFSNLADSVWFAILLCIAAGFCITRNDLGPHKSVVITIPLIFFVTSLVVDYVLYAARGFDAFNTDTAYDPSTAEPGEEDVGAFTGLVFFVCIVANMMAFMLAWFYIFDTIQKEREILEGRAEGAAAEGAAAPAAPGLPVSQMPGEGGVGHTHVPDDIVLLEQGQNASHIPVYGGVEGEDLDAPKTVQDRIAHREKIRLMRQFFYGVSFYVVATLLVLFLPIFVSSVVDKTMLILQNAVLWLFLASLCFIFRMRDDNPYLMLDEEGETGLGGVETTTELGVLVGPHGDDHDSPPPVYAQMVKSHHGSGSFAAAGGAAGSSAAAGAAGAAALPTLPLPPPPMAAQQAQQQREEDDYVQHHFTLDDEDDDHEQHGIMRGPSSTAQPRPSVNTDAARQGVLVTALPSPKLS